MTSIALIELGHGVTPTAAMCALPRVDMVAVSLAVDLDVAAIRARLREEARRYDGFVISVGSGRDNPAVGGGWRDLAAPLRRSFAVLTGAAAGLVECGGGPVVILLPSFALVDPRQPSQKAVYARAVLGMAEALRAELGTASTRASIVFYAIDVPDDTVVPRLQYALAHAPMYSLSPDLTSDRIRAYFEPMLRAVDRSSAGPPLPDIGPMAAVYDPAAIGLPEQR